MNCFTDTQTTVRKDMDDILIIRDQAEKLRKEARVHGALQRGNI